MRVTGGFFWMQDKPAIQAGRGAGTSIERCVICTRPKWWQLPSWYRAWRLWLSLPYATCATQASAVEARPRLGAE